MVRVSACANPFEALSRALSSPSSSSSSPPPSSSSASLVDAGAVGAKKGSLRARLFVRWQPHEGEREPHGEPHAEPHARVNARATWMRHSAAPVCGDALLACAELDYDTQGAPGSVSQGLERKTTRLASRSGREPSYLVACVYSSCHGLQSHRPQREPHPQRKLSAAHSPTPTTSPPGSPLSSTGWVEQRSVEEAAVWEWVLASSPQGAHAAALGDPRGWVVRLPPAFDAAKHRYGRAPPENPAR